VFLIIVTNILLLINSLIGVTVSLKYIKGPSQVGVELQP